MPVVAVRSTKLLSPDDRRSVFVFPHTWTFVSQEQALNHLSADSGLAANVAKALESLDGAKDASAQTQRDAPAAPRALLDSVYKLAFQYQVAAYDQQGKVVPQTHYWVNFDRNGPAFVPFSNAPSLMCTVFIDVGLSRAFTVLWPHHQVPSGSLLMRSELTPMPNYAHVDYWKRHYDVSSSSQHHDWFVPWKAVRGVVMNALPNRGRGSVALNLGCGNSRSSREIIGDEAASFILNVDVARSSMDGILRIALEDEAKASRAASQQSALKGIEQFVTLDAVQMPFRSGGIVDWIFDKGTLDGILYNPEGVQMLRQIWARLGQILVPGGLLVLVSLGRPEGRLDLIENQIGGWMVDDCFEVTTAKGAESATFQFGSGIDSCFVYICRKV